MATDWPAGPGGALPGGGQLGPLGAGLGGRLALVPDQGRRRIGQIVDDLEGRVGRQIQGQGQPRGRHLGAGARAQEALPDVVARGGQAQDVHRAEDAAVLEGLRLPQLRLDLGEALLGHGGEGAGLQEPQVRLGGALGGVEARTLEVGVAALAPLLSSPTRRLIAISPESGWAIVTVTWR